MRDRVKMEHASMRDKGAHEQKMGGMRDIEQTNDKTGYEKWGQEML